MLFATVKNLDNLPLAEGLELRLDAFETIPFAQLETLIQTSSIPLLFTLRKGSFLGTEAERLTLLEKLFALRPAFIDLEHDTDRVFAERMAKRYPEVKIICSYHNFDQTPEDLTSILSAMEAPFFYAYKLATEARSSLDALRMLQFVKAQTKRVSGICMGTLGQITRVLGKIMGNFIDYASVDGASYGQLTLQELNDLYRYQTLNRHTAIYGLIGGNVSKSLGHFAHNRVMQTLGFNAVYVKISLATEELETFFSLAKTLGFAGLSVTMPFKEAILPHLDHIDPLAAKMGAVNTIVWEKGELVGFNTDGDGAADALEQKGALQGKNVIILGAGGAAKAIAHIIHQRGGYVTILNRTAQKAEQLALQCGGKGGGLEHILEEHQRGYDVLINCTPDPLPIDPRYLLSSAVIMDIKTLPQENSLLAHAKERGSRLVYGYEMFINQAVIQQKIWFKQRMIQEITYEVISREVIARVL